jgi:hypothetical protein
MHRVSGQLDASGRRAVRTIIPQVPLATVARGPPGEIEPPDRAIRCAGEQPAAPGRACREHLVDRRLTCVRQLESEAPVRPGLSLEGRAVDVAEAVDAVAIRDRENRADRGAGPWQRRDAGGGTVVEPEDAVQQRAPRKQDPDLVGQAGELGRRGFRCGDDEERVRNATPGGGPRGTT